MYITKWLFKSSTWTLTAISEGKQDQKRLNYSPWSLSAQPKGVSLSSWTKRWLLNKEVLKMQVFIPKFCLHNLNLSLLHRWRKTSLSFEVASRLRPEGVLLRQLQTFLVALLPWHPHLRLCFRISSLLPSLGQALVLKYTSLGPQVAAHFFAELVFCRLNFLNLLTRRSDMTRTCAKGGVGVWG